MREGLTQKSVDEILQKRQLKLFRHVVKMEERRKPREILEARTKGRRGRGRPRKGYMDKIEGKLGNGLER